MGAKGQKLSKTQRRKISEGRRRAYLASLEREDLIKPTFKKCPKCREIKPVESQFHWRKYALKSGVVRKRPESACKDCKNAENKAVREREVAEGLDLYDRWRRWFEKKGQAYYEQVLARKREHEAIRRRREGIPLKPGHYKRAPSKRGLSLPAEPLALLLEREEEGCSRALIAERTGVDERRIYDLVERISSKVSLAVADQLLTGLGLPHELSILYPEA